MIQGASDGASSPFTPVKKDAVPPSGGQLDSKGPAQVPSGSGGKVDQHPNDGERLQNAQPGDAPVRARSPEVRKEPVADSKGPDSLGIHELVDVLHLAEKRIKSASVPNGVLDLYDQFSGVQLEALAVHFDSLWSKVKQARPDLQPPATIRLGAGSPPALLEKLAVGFKRIATVEIVRTEDGSMGNLNIPRDDQGRPRIQSFTILPNKLQAESVSRSPSPDGSVDADSDDWAPREWIGIKHTPQSIDDDGMVTLRANAMLPGEGELEGGLEVRIPLEQWRALA